jgi:hypothetical protein
MIYGCLAGDPSTRKYQPAVLQVAQYWRQNTMTADGFWHLEKKESILDDETLTLVVTSTLQLMANGC